MEDITSNAKREAIIKSLYCPQCTCENKHSIEYVDEVTGVIEILYPWYIIDIDVEFLSKNFFLEYIYDSDEITYKVICSDDK
ncbi:MAG: hypothetical protein M0R46_09985 [Candidatus Muirbacterium halophilum]|nr:hypothetical protein [Candidatus Muirbacterium halophilum]